MSNLVDLATQAIASCRGDHLVASFFSEYDPLNAFFEDHWYLIAIGKASGSMASGALALGSNTLVSGLIVAKSNPDQWISDDRLSCMTAGHPIPNEASLYAGDQLLTFIDRLPADARVLFLLSGGASALVEVLPNNYSLNQWQKETESWLASGWSIAQINAQRKRISCIKAGKLLRRFPVSAQILQLVVSDVEGDDLTTIGSGLLSGGVVASRQLQSFIVGNAARLMRYVEAHEPSIHRMAMFMNSDVMDLARLMVSQCCHRSGLWMWVGEPVVTLPGQHGFGGRMQQLALILVWLLRDALQSWQCVAIASDGSDGNTNDAGAFVSEKSYHQAQQKGWDVHQTILACNSNALLADIDALVVTGDTGTNVNDMVVLWVG